MDSGNMVKESGESLVFLLAVKYVTNYLSNQAPSSPAILTFVFD